MKFVKYPRISRAIAVAIPAAILGLLTACVTPPPRVYRAPAAPPPPQRVFVYPAHGQSPDQTERDRYECHIWAVQQTGIDPSRADANAQSQAQQTQQQVNMSAAEGRARADTYRRAIGACLQGRGYTVT